jgi:hypothetical protein
MSVLQQVSGASVKDRRQHRNGIDMHVLLAGNVPKFHVAPQK